MKRETRDIFLAHLRELRIPAPEWECRVTRYREWRFDFAWPDLELAVECDGAGPRKNRGIGRHQDPRTRQDDMDKHNAAEILGWHVLHFTTPDLLDSTAAKTIAVFFKRLAGVEDLEGYCFGFLPEVFQIDHWRRVRRQR